MTETLQLAGLVFDVRRSERRKTLGLTVERGGKLVVHAPAVVTADALAGWINKKLLWVHRKLALKEKTAPKMRAPEYFAVERSLPCGQVRASSSSYHGSHYPLAVRGHNRDGLKLPSILTSLAVLSTSS